MKPRTRKLALAVAIVLAAGLGYTALMFAAFLEFDCHRDPIDNFRCTEMNLYAIFGLVSCALAILLALMVLVGIVRGFLRRSKPSSG